jgi:hypothetical protein
VAFDSPFSKPPLVGVFFDLLNCGLQRNCYPDLVNCMFEGIYQLATMPDGGFKMDITLAFPYNLDNWYNKEITTFKPVCGEC